VAKQFDKIEQAHSEFIKKQHVFFVASAGKDGFVSLSPKGMDTFRVTGPNSIVWLNLTGSGNETSVNVQENCRMTVMFCSFDKEPLVLRLYGTAQVLHQRDSEWPGLIKMFPSYTGARQIFKMNVQLVLTSCGYAVPLMEFKGERDLLTKWTDARGRDSIEKYWREKNTVSLDGRPTNIVKD